MSERENILDGAWIESAIIGGKKLQPLSYGRIKKLQKIGNACFSDDTTEQDDLSAVIEIIYAMTLDPQAVIDYAEKPKNERDDLLTDFALLHESELTDLIEKILASIKRIGVAKMETQTMGKDHRHA